jgi:flavin reductase (DIM6/NTAB) family NADH-FMN oxidoreductase RutF
MPETPRAPSHTLGGDFTVATEAGVLEGDFTIATVPGQIELSELVTGSEVVDQDAFKAAMRVFPAGVVIVTTRVDGRPWGLTISSCCSVSVEPPQILISLRSSTVTCRTILEGRSFGVSMLATDQKALAEHGAAVGSAKFIDEFCETGGECETLESPMASGALYHLDCSMAAHYQASDHELIVGLVRRAITLTSRANPEPLLYFDRRFWELGPELH